jgi:hypothetical protein
MEMQEFKFQDIYSLASLIDQSVDYEEDFWNFDIEYFLNASTNFSKDTLLHQYIVTRALNHYSRYFRKNVDSVEEEIDQWIPLFEAYEVTSEPFNFIDDEDPHEWFMEKEEIFYTLFDRMADEVFYILFANRNFLVKFNLLVAKTVQQFINKTYPFEHHVDPNAQYPKDKLTNKGRIKRKSIPSWVKNAVFHRDKGRCVYCNTDLTGIINHLTAKNFDHIVPLDIFGTNDPCNIQLTCETCNKSKSNKSNRFASTSCKYQPWWPIDK